MCIKKKKQQTAFKFFVRGIKSLYFVTRQEVNSFNDSNRALTEFSIAVLLYNWIPMRSSDTMQLFVVVIFNGGKQLAVALQQGGYT